MRESIGESWTLQIVAAFILLFVAFLALIISYSKCFKTKNEVISIIEKYEGITSKSAPIIEGFLNNTSYKGYGKCNNDYSGIGALIAGEGNYGLPVDSNKFEKAQKNKNYRMCVYRRKADNDATLAEYEIVLFYSFNIPAFGNIATFPVSGKTVGLNDKYKVET